MLEQEKIFVLEEILEIEQGSLSLNSKLTDYPGWDSLAVITLLTYFDNQFGIRLKLKDFKKFTTVSDVLMYM